MLQSQSKNRKPKTGFEKKGKRDCLRSECVRGYKSQSKNKNKNTNKNKNKSKNKNKNKNIASQNTLRHYALQSSKEIKKI
jgi:hypothetical protein